MREGKRATSSDEDSLAVHWREDRPIGLPSGFVLTTPVEERDPGGTATLADPEMADVIRQQLVNPTEK